MAKTYTEVEIQDAVMAYADHHNVAMTLVDVSRNYQGDEVIGFRLSLDFYGVSRGCDEVFGEWN